MKERPCPGHLSSASLLPPTSSTASAGSEAGEETSRETQLFPAFAKLEGGRSQIDTGQQFLHWVHQVLVVSVLDTTLYWTLLCTGHYTVLYSHYTTLYY